MTKLQHAVSALLEDYGIAAVAAALREEMRGIVSGLTVDELREWNAALETLEELTKKIT